MDKEQQMPGAKRTPLGVERQPRKQCTLLPKLAHVLHKQQQQQQQEKGATPTSISTSASADLLSGGCPSVLLSQVQPSGLPLRPARTMEAPMEQAVGGDRPATNNKTENRKKRSASEAETEAKHDEGECVMPSTPSAKRCRGKWRKPTYLIRKEEKSELLEHIKALEDQVAFLQNRTNIVAWQAKDRQQIEKEIHNNLLRDSLRQHQLRVLSAQSAFSELTHSVNNRCPIETYIHLARDWEARNATLVGLKQQQCRDASELVQKRTQFLTETREFMETAQFVDEEGDFCSIRFDTTPLEGLTTVKDAFEFIQFHIRHMDTKPMSNKYTCTTDHGPDNSVLHRRLIISEVEDVTTETNFVMFSERRPIPGTSDRHGSTTESSSTSQAKAGAEEGVMVLNFVDEDELYPYRSESCVRLDISGVMALKETRRRVKTARGEEKDEPVIVLTRWMMQKLRRSELPVPKHVMQTMREHINDPGNAILRAVKEARVPMELNASDARILSF